MAGHSRGASQMQRSWQSTVVAVEHTHRHVVSVVLVLGIYRLDGA